jgi:hypothetical protein
MATSSRRLGDALCRAAALFIACSLAAPGAALGFVPSNVMLEESARTLTFTSDGVVLSSATLCPAFAFDVLGVGEPTFSPDLHWVLVDVLGPFEPGDVPRTHAIIDVRTGGLVLGPDFPAYVGVPSTTGGLSWASGELATLRYESGGRTVNLHDPPLRPLPVTNCR